MTPHPARKLSAREAAEIRAYHRRKMRTVQALQSLYSKPALAARYGVSENVIDRLLRGESYKEVA